MIEHFDTLSRPSAITTLEGFLKTGNLVRKRVPKVELHDDDLMQIKFYVDPSKSVYDDSEIKTFCQLTGFQSTVHICQKAKSYSDLPLMMGRRLLKSHLWPKKRKTKKSQAKKPQGKSDDPVAHIKSGQSQAKKPQGKSDNPVAHIKSGHFISAWVCLSMVVVVVYFIVDYICVNYRA